MGPLSPRWVLCSLPASTGHHITDCYPLSTEVQTILSLPRSALIQPVLLQLTVWNALKDCQSLSKVKVYYIHHCHFITEGTGVNKHDQFLENLCYLLVLQLLWLNSSW